MPDVQHNYSSLLLVPCYGEGMKLLNQLATISLLLLSAIEDTSMMQLMCMCIHHPILHCIVLRTWSPTHFPRVLASYP